MKIVDQKETDVKYCKKFYKQLDNKLRKCSSFVGQKNILLNKYNEDSFKRDFLVRRKMQLERTLKYNYGKMLVYSMGIIFPIFGGCLTYFSDKGWLAFVCFLIIAIWNVCSLVQNLQQQLQTVEIPLYEIREFERTLINDLLSQDKEEVNLFDFVQKN